MRGICWMFGPEQRVRAVRVNPYFGWTTESVSPARNWQALAACSSSSQVRMNGSKGAKGVQSLSLSVTLPEGVRASGAVQASRGGNQTACSTSSVRS